MHEMALDDDVTETIQIAEKVMEARTNKFCVTCFKVISIGTRYRRITWKVDGEIIVTASHPECIVR